MPLGRYPSPVLTETIAHAGHEYCVLARVSRVALSLCASVAQFWVMWVGALGCVLRRPRRCTGARFRYEVTDEVPGMVMA